MDGKQKIIEAAGKVISEQGLSNATVRLIAETAGTSTGAIYYYYSSKEAMLVDLFDLNSSYLLKPFLNLPGGEKLDRKELAVWLDKLEEYYQNLDSKRLSLFLAQEAILGNEDLHQRFQLRYHEWIDMIHQCIAPSSSLYQEGFSRELAVLMMAAIDGLTLQYLLGIEEVSRQECREGALYILEQLLFK
ncbi:MAG TPA: TetR/AcrR family transcriptional regulator [Syntrophomonadaceae bacterium]|jgi:AcrR family transcriptional regulator|nr:TetR/AcrR family transcriptional regulator [Syntrophomonadaceae bacterium]